MVFFAVENLF